MPTLRIGLEIHIQLATASKCFCPCPVEYNAPPNTNICPVCMGYPGALPVLNRRAMVCGIALGLALESTIHEESRFDRKNYFYPDLPKGYQITQQDYPLCTGGEISLGNGGAPGTVRVKRIHIEEDAAKMMHTGDATLLDFNRCGIPLLELVTEPDITTPEDAAACVSEIQRLVRWLEISDAEMSLGQLRCDVNISLADASSRTEVKNLNSLRSIREAIAFEAERQAALVQDGKGLVQETLLWDEDRRETVPMRDKGAAEEYRYMPEPDLLPLRVPTETVNVIRESLPELPYALYTRLCADYGLTAAQAGVLTTGRDVAEYFLATAHAAPECAELAATWIAGEVLHALHESGGTAADFPVRPGRLAQLLERIADGTVSGTAAKQVFAAMLSAPDSPDDLIESMGLAQISDEAQLREAVLNAITAHPDAAAQLRKGKDRAAGFLVGQVMQATRGKADPVKVRALIESAVEGGE